MKKTSICILLALCCMLIFATACKKEDKNPLADGSDLPSGTMQNPYENKDTDKTDPPENPETPDKQDPPENPGVTDNPDDPKIPDTGETPDDPVVPDVPEDLNIPQSPNGPLYTVKVTDPNHPIYSTPDKSTASVGSVQIAASYTITQQVQGENNTLWGKLLSGAGWIEVTGLTRRYKPHMVLTADYASADLLKSENVHKYDPGVNQYTQPVSIVAHRTLKNFAFHATELGGNARMNITQTLYTLPELTPDKPFVAYISFPGDFTTFALTFTDEAGVEYIYHISQSGRDGSVALTDMSPE